MGMPATIRVVGPGAGVDQKVDVHVQWFHKKSFLQAVRDAVKAGWRQDRFLVGLIHEMAKDAIRDADYFENSQGRRDYIYGPWLSPYDELDDDFVVEVLVEQKRVRVSIPGERKVSIPYVEPWLRGKKKEKVADAAS